MRIEYLLITVYFMLAFWGIPKIPFIRHAGFTSLQTRLLLAFKIFCGIICAYYFEKISTNIDYVGYNAAGNIQYDLLLSRPQQFFTGFNTDLHKYGTGGLFESKDSFWAYLRFNLLYKFIAVCDLVTAGNFYFNTIIFCTLVFFGHIAFYRIYSEIYKGHQRKILFACFFLPSLSLYTSCVHKDGIIFISLGLLSYIFYRALSTSRALHIRYAVVFLSALIIIFLFRNYVVVALIPAMLTALACRLLPYRKILVISFAYLFFSGLFFLSGFTRSSLNLPAAVVQRKSDFAVLASGNTNIPMRQLTPSPQSFIATFPQAVNHSLLRPYLWEFSKPAVLLTALELFCYQVIILAFIFFHNKRPFAITAFNIFGCLFFINMLLIIGYTIPNIGAIVRYRSIFWVFLLCPVLCNTHWQQVPWSGKRLPV